MRRYNLADFNSAGTDWLAEDPKGNVVLYDDVAPLIEALRYVLYALHNGTADVRIEFEVRATLKKAGVE